ncbi:MAG: hypothetical protein AB1640_08820 [bacterium]
MELLRFVFVQHLGPACWAALLAAAGCLLAVAVERLELERLLDLSMLLFRMALRLVGREANARMAAAIFAFNGTAIFLYLACGFHPALPAAIALLTGFNVTAILLAVSRTAAASEESLPRTGGRRVPGRNVTTLCGTAVLLLELPCFAFSVGMGIRLGQDVLAGRTGYLEGLALRAEAYAAVILPLLFVSAICETVAIRGMAVAAE